jgi:hypothetical protein
MQYKESSFSFIAEVHPVLLEQKNLAYAEKQTNINDNQNDNDNLNQNYNQFVNRFFSE